MNQAKKTYTFIAVCVLAIGAGAFFLRNQKPPSVEINDRMVALQVAIENWNAEKGRPPETLDELGLPKEEMEDVIKEVFQYSVSEDGKTVTLATYGADRKPGGKMFHADRELVFTLGESKQKNSEKAD